MKTLVDTNVIINLLFKDQPYHEKAKKIWNSSEKIYIPSIVLFEFSYYIYKKDLDTNLIALVLSDWRVELVETSQSDIYFALKNSPKSYDEFNDYIILHTAIRLKAKLVTFDKELKDKYKRF